MIQRIHLRPNAVLFAVLAALGFALVLAGRVPIEYVPIEVRLFHAALDDTNPAVEVRTARGEWAQVVPAGQDVPVHLTLDSRVADLPDDDLLSIENLYASAAAQVEARLEMRAVTVHPAGSILQRLTPAAPTGLFWRIHARRAGIYEGTLWIYVLFDGAEGQQTRQLVFARPVTITAVDVLGFPPHQVRHAGWAGMGLGLLAALPFWRRLLLGWWARARNENEPDSQPDG